eukprot:Gregarina_sp_Poly_1__1524@NODE_1383_length_4248_cov_66_729491_g927_i0_p2_GENE_NODE_1383_length_4248_cov_66_729491_g927_i0NODE_1383_length_4248_cov_66_729491_g927_i0_p2_ORF_typecomplete_len303_score60_06CS/PF04969_16/7_9e14Nudc_N/PF14050_6/1_6e13Alpha_GJ/PF03229_13/1_5_NODE_1383_length_4248_cov_66_729491_g927_i027935
MTEAGSPCDGIFLGIADKHGGLEGFLEEVFSFLDRRTDFFDLKKESESKLLQTYRKYADIHAERKREAFRKEQTLLEKAPAFEEVFDEPSPTKQEPKSAPPKPQPSTSHEIPSPTTTKATEASTPEKESSDDVLIPNSGNGATLDKYSWTQTLSTVEIQIPLCTSNVRAKECKVKIGTESLFVEVRKQVYLDGRLSSKIVIDDSFWIINDGNTLTLTLDKMNKMQWWDRCLESEKKIDTSKVLPENSKLSDLDPETRQTVEKMMFEQQQKKLGRAPPQHQELLRKFQEAHPELDFSGAKMNF